LKYGGGESKNRIGEQNTTRERKQPAFSEKKRVGRNWWDWRVDAEPELHAKEGI